MFKIDLTGRSIPKVVNPSGRLFDNMRVGPCKYGYPILYNAAAIERQSELWSKR